MYKTFTMELAGRTMSVDIGRVAAQANGAAFMHYGDTTVLCTATASDKPRDGIDFFPLSVEYEEKLYAVGKIPADRTQADRVGLLIRAFAPCIARGDTQLVQRLFAMAVRPPQLCGRDIHGKWKRMMAAAGYGNRKLLFGYGIPVKR